MLRSNEEVKGQNVRQTVVVNSGLVNVHYKKSWSELREDVRTLRRRLWASLGRGVPKSFVFLRTQDGTSTRIYFMSTEAQSREARIFCMNVDDTALPLYPLTHTVVFPWELVLYFEAQQGSWTTPSKDELLLMERKRQTSSGITSYDLHPMTPTFLVSSSSQLFRAIDTEGSETEYPLTVLEIPAQSSSGARINAEMCPKDKELIAYVCEGDVWVIYQGREYRLTYSHSRAAGGGTLSASKDPISAGLPSYVMQEEFNRYHGFWWQPAPANTTKHHRDLGKTVYRLVYEQVDESQVNTVRLLTLPEAQPEIYRFPSAGTPNARSELKLVEFSFKHGDLKMSECKYTLPIQQYFAWAEYVVRVGWTPCARFIWVQLLNRSHTRLELVLFPVSAAAAAAATTPPFHVIYSETDIWIHITDLLTFLPNSMASTRNPNTDRVHFIWASETTGYRHLYYIQSRLTFNGCSSGGQLAPQVLRKIAVTGGDWEVVNQGQLAVIMDYQFVFFHGLQDSPIEQHVYVVSFSGKLGKGEGAGKGPRIGSTYYDSDGESYFVHEPEVGAGTVRRLTELGSSNLATFNDECSLVVLAASSITCPVACKLYRLSMMGLDVADIEMELLTFFLPPVALDRNFSRPVISVHRLAVGVDLYAMIYRPINFTPTEKYPTILNVYGGPQVQMVQNSFRGTGQLWIHLLASAGYCVLNIDSRGSDGRGLQFAAHIRNKMGTVEMADQVEVLKQLIAEHAFIDADRIGIYGWSYGGYLSLMGLVQYPALFKVAVAGAPVSSWELYDTAYTERYMDLPTNNAQGYEQGSLLNHVGQFPDEEGRLLIVHGLLDDNVHFTHTARLISALVRAGKPHQLQMYPTERHSLRKLEASEHFETTLLSFLQRTL